MSVDDLAPICNMGGGQLAALRAAMSRMEELIDSAVITNLGVERVGRAWVVTTDSGNEVFLWANYTHSERSSDAAATD